MHDPNELFRSTAAYYARYRPGYPPEFFARLRELFALDGRQTALDLGCGTGQIAVPFAGSVARVIAVDPQPDMLDLGRDYAADRGVTNVDWRVGDSTKLAELDLPVLDLVLMGSSFHWMDRDAVLATFDELVAPDGGIVVAGTDAADPTPPAWAEAIREVRERYLGPERRAGKGTYSHPPDRHETVLARSPFSNIQTESWHWTIDRDIGSIIGLQLSYSYSAPALLGDRVDQFVTDLTKALQELIPDGHIVEQVKTEALIARRP